jgi:hypothetical protein
MTPEESRQLLANLKQIEMGLRRIKSASYELGWTLAMLKRIDVLVDAISIKKNHFGLAGWTEVSPE